MNMCMFRLQYTDVLHIAWARDHELVYFYTHIPTGTVGYLCVSGMQYASM
jgi:hypothetical protein